VRFADLLRISLAACGHQKTRTLLTLLGVVFASVVLALSIAVGLGVHRLVLHEFSRYDQFRRIQVWPGASTSDESIPSEEVTVKGEMSDAKRERIRKLLVRRWERAHGLTSYKRLTGELVRELAALPHVEQITPAIHDRCQVFFEGKPAELVNYAAAPDDRAFPARLVAGQPLTERTGNSILLHEFLLYLWGIPSEEDVQETLGKKLRLEYRAEDASSFHAASFLTQGKVNLTPEESRMFFAALSRLPAGLEQFDLSPAERSVLRRVLRSIPSQPASDGPALYSGEFTILGVVRDPTPEELQQAWGFQGQEVDVYLPVQTAQGVFLRAPHNAEGGFHMLTITVDSNDHVKEVAEALRDQGLSYFSLVEPLEQMQRNIVLITLGMAGIALVTLLVAAMGITNTMIMSVLQRTREIGIMKAVGAKDRHIQMIFLLEGALIGGVGGCLGLICSWLLSFPLDTLAGAQMELQTKHALDGSILDFPCWLILGLPLFTGLVTTLAAVYPARRAAKVDPIASLRHE
jgi:putative ABC transport system permease protein